MSERNMNGDLNSIAPNNSDRARNKVTPNAEGNADKAKTPPKKMKAIVKGPVVQQKPSFFSKVKESFLGEGGNLGEYIVYDILIPAFRNTLSDMGFGLVEMLFGRGSGRSNYGYNGRIVRDRGRSYISYNDMFNTRGRGDRREVDRGERARHDFGNIVYTSRGEAEDVLSKLVDLTLEYGEATVAAFYELSSIDSTPADSRYGWTNLRDAYTERVRNGYIIRFPQVRPL